MKILMVGLGKGSWEMRGQQLGAALGARVTSEPTAADLTWADVAYVVKRSEPRFGPMIRAAGVPLVWDALDCWRQPADNALDARGARQLLQNHLDVITPALTIGATQAQADAAGGVYLPHHGWLGLEPRPIGPMRTVAYQGNAGFLGRWASLLDAACSKRGWRFVINPADLRIADLIVALRDGPWDGWACREWKSGVKLVNAILAGRPVLTQDTAAFREIQPPGAALASFDDLEPTLERWSDEGWRETSLTRCRLLAPLYTVERIAEQLRGVLEQVPCPA